MFNQLQRFRNRTEEAKIIVAGIPRCGTALLWRAIAGLPTGETTPPDYMRHIKKTHLPAPMNIPKNYKALFVFEILLRL